MNFNLAGFGTTIVDIKKDHRGIDEGVFRVELGIERADVVPEGSVLDGDSAAGSHAPSEFVEFFDRDRTAVGEGGDLFNVAAEIADFVESIPGGHLDFQLALNVGDFQGDMEEVLLGMSKRDAIKNRGVGGENAA